MTANATPAGETAAAPAGIDLTKLAAYLPAFIPAATGPLSAELISGGRSNLTYYIRSPHGEWVLRRPPLGHVLPTAHDMAREFRVITALRETAVPVPGTLVLCEDTEVIGAPFYVMERAHGIIMHEEIPDNLAPMPKDRRRLSEAFVDALVELHAVDYDAVGLDDFGRPQGFIERQVRRWGEQWERSKVFELPEIDALRRRLAAALPESPAPTIVHGDYRLENMIFAEHRPDEIVAILDWEMSTIGDPLADFGYALIYWVQAGDSQPRADAMDRGRLTMADGFMTRAELIERYAAKSGRSVDNLDFYQVFGIYKLAIIVAGIHARYVMGQTLGEGFETYGDKLRLLAQLAWQVANESSDPVLRGERSA
ncbi:MAG: phosphotransferase family protein [Dehalococcoidia bacterium]